MLPHGQAQAQAQVQQKVQAEAQGKWSSVRHQLDFYQQQLQQDPQGLAPSASHTWPNLAPIRGEPSSLVPHPPSREDLPRPEAELKPPSLRQRAEWFGQQHLLLQICSPFSAMVSPVGGCPYPPCQLYCPEGHSRSEQRLTSTETFWVVAEGAALDGFWRSRFRSRPCKGTSGMNPSCHGRPCGHRRHTDRRNPCIPRPHPPPSTGPSATACRQAAGHQGRSGRTRRHPVGSSLLRRPTAAPGAARAASGPAGAVAAEGGTVSPASAAAWGRAAGAGRPRRRACGPPGTDSPFDPAAAEASTAPLSSSSQRRLYQAPAAAANHMRAAKPTLERL